MESSIWFFKSTLIAMSRTSKHLILVAIICLVMLSINHGFCEHGSRFENIVPAGESARLDSFGMAIFLAGSIRLGLALGTLFIVKISKRSKADQWESKLLRGPHLMQRNVRPDPQMELICEPYHQHTDIMRFSVLFRPGWVMAGEEILESILSRKTTPSLYQ